MSYDDSETYTLQMLYGVLPEDLWHHAKESGKDSFLGYSKSQKRLSKRKFRKLKRKAGVRLTDSVTIMWLKINRYLKATISNE
jgi:hypothetical protein